MNFYNGSVHIIRGGSITQKLNDPATFRQKIPNGFKSNWIGFRCACDAQKIPEDIEKDFFTDK
jgi:formylglycine-generating enzyme required for sulfatase activity